MWTHMWYLTLYYGQNAVAPREPGKFALRVWSSDRNWRDSQDFLAGISRKDIGRIEVDGIGIVWQEIPTHDPDFWKWRPLTEEDRQKMRNMGILEDFIEAADASETKTD